MSNHKKYHLGIKGLIRNKNGEILLLLKSASRTVVYGQEIHWDLPGGRIDEGATIDETLKREISEEVGIQNFDNKGLFDAVVSNIEIKNENCGLILFVYEIKPRGEYHITLDNEHTEFGWFDKTEAAQKLSFKYPSSFVKKLETA